MIERRGDGRWLIRWEVGADGATGRKRKSKVVKGTRREAEKELTRIKAELDQGTYFEATRETVSDYLERWLTDVAALKASDRSLVGYRLWIREFIIPRLGAIELARLQPMRVQQFYIEMLTNGRKKALPDGTKGLSSHSVLHIHRILRNALGQAVRWQLIPRNPCDAVEPPKLVEREMNATDEAGVAKLLENFRDTPLYVPVLLATHCGLRRGEILGLRWQDVDLDQGTLSVNQSAEVINGEVRFKAPKTKKSRRTIALPLLVVQALKAHIVQQRGERLATGADYQESGLVVCKPDGRAWRPTAFTQSFRWHKAKTDAAHLRFHDLRHSHASILGKAGVPLATISRRLGHSQISTTANVYSHLLDGMDQEAARRIDRAFGHEEG